MVDKTKRDLSARHLEGEEFQPNLFSSGFFFFPLSFEGYFSYFLCFLLLAQTSVRFSGAAGLSVVIIYSKD